MAMTYCSIARQMQPEPCHHSSCQLTDAELNALAHSLAVESAEALVEGCCLPVRHDKDSDGWWSDVADVDDAAATDVSDALKYLNARGLIVQHPQHPNWITVADESEATR